MRQFFLELAAGGVPTAGDTVALDLEESHHLFTVLRGGRDQVLNLVDGRGHRLTAVVAGQEGKRALVRIETVAVDAREDRPPRLVLACAVVKGKRFEWAVEKAVELGAHQIIPLRCEHGVIEPRAGKQSRWSTLMKAALKQCGRSWLPDLSLPQALAAVVAGGPDDCRFFGAAPWEMPAGTVRPWTSLLSEPAPESPSRLVFFVGPEGGWSAGELDLLGRHAEPLSLGPHVLRAETAAAAGLTAMQAVRQTWLEEV